MKVLALTSIFANGESPHYAPYTLRQALELARLVDLEQWATIPWFPGGGALSRLVGKGKDHTGVPASEQLEGLPVQHPRFLRVPRIGLSVAATTYAASILPRLRKGPRPDVLLATWAYPDGAAALMVGRLLSIPVVVQVIGSDVNVLARRPVVRAHLSRLLPQAGGVVAVSEPLAASMRGLGAPSHRTHTIPTGVDTIRFRPASRANALAKLGLAEDARVILFVGRLVRDKGVFELLDAFAKIAQTDPRLHLVVLGDGPARPACDRRAKTLPKRLHVLGEANHERVATWMAASWLLTLPSYMEGTPNVLLEAFASGRPVVATDVGGIPSMFNHDVQGRVVAARDVAALAEALLHVAQGETNPGEVVAAARLFDWTENARRVHAVLQAAV